MIRRVWLFATVPRDSERALWLQRVEWLQVTDMAIFVNSLGDRQFTLSKSKAQRRIEIAQQLAEIDVDTHLVSWLRPTSSYMLRAAELMRSLCERSGARSLLFDVEEPWTQHTSITRGVL